MPLEESLIRHATRGQILRLASPPGSSSDPDAVWKRLGHLDWDGPREFTGLLLVLIGCDYKLSNPDVTALFLAMRDTPNRRMLPCAVVLEKEEATRIARILEVTKLVNVVEFRIVDSESTGMEHIEKQIGKWPV